VEELHWYNKAGVPPLAETLMVVVVPLQMVWSEGWEFMVGLATTVNVTQFDVAVHPDAVCVTTQ